MGEFDWTSFIENLWDRENAQGKKGIEGEGGFRGGYPYTTPNGDTDIGPGFDLSKQTPAFRERAKKGFTRKELDALIQDRLQNERYWFNQRIAKEGGNDLNSLTKAFNEVAQINVPLKDSIPFNEIV